MALRFSKMHGLGNDFVVIDAINQAVSMDATLVRRLADRHTGVGCDQLLLVERATDPGCDFRYRIFNADGGEVEQCGNGARCFTRFVTDQGLTDRRQLQVETAAGRLVLQLGDDGQVTVEMGVPEFEPGRIPFVAEARASSYVLTLPGGPVTLAAVALGNPHAVLRVDHVETAPVAELGAQIESHPRFPKRVNVGFMEVVSRDRIRLRVFERGVGETLACGSGACAAVAVGRDQGVLGDTVAVDLTGGRLVISWPGSPQPLRMTGPAAHVFEGVIEP